MDKKTGDFVSINFSVDGNQFALKKKKEKLSKQDLLGFLNMQVNFLQNFVGDIDLDIENKVSTKPLSAAVEKNLEQVMVSQPEPAVEMVDVAPEEFIPEAVDIVETEKNATIKTVLESNVPQKYNPTWHKPEERFNVTFHSLELVYFKPAKREAYETPLCIFTYNGKKYHLKGVCFTQYLDKVEPGVKGRIYRERQGKNSYCLEKAVEQ